MNICLTPPEVDATFASPPASCPSPAPDAPSDAATNPSARPAPSTCTNCDAELTGAYCTVCGQRSGNRIVPLWQVSNEFLEDLFDLDLRILRTFPTFLFRPGHLTVEYVRGRRRRYIRPLRLYLFSSFLLFTVLALTNLNGFSFSLNPSTEATKAEMEVARAELVALRANLESKLNPTSPRPEPAVSASDSTQGEAQAPVRAAGVAPEAPKAVMREIDGALASLDQMTEDGERTGALVPLAVHETDTKMADAGGPSPIHLRVLQSVHDPSKVLRGVIDRAPYLMFLLVPTFALLLKLLYLRRRRLYLEHLIFALHVHALAFLVFAVSAGLGALNVGTALNLDGWLIAAPFGYLLVAMRHVYRQSMAMTALKTVALLLAYGIILAGAVVLLALATVAFG